MDVTHRCMPEISICRSPETEPPEPLETRTLVVRRIFDEGQVVVWTTDRRLFWDRGTHGFHARIQLLERGIGAQRVHQRVLEVKPEIPIIVSLLQPSQSFRSSVQSDVD